MRSHSLRPALSRIGHGFVTCVSIFAIGVQPILAQGIVPDAAATGGLNVITAPNGVPLVNIATPNGQGLSHNTYDQFNVGTPGLILNNETGTFGATQLGGVAPGNANLATSGAARVILNEVTSANPSALNGVVEIAGQSAEVIVANPNGISCNGCGFIRTPRAVLTTGTPDITGGTLQGFTVNGGEITFGANGADLSQVNLFDIISRQVTFEGAVTGQEVRIAAGRNSVDYATGNVTALTPDGSTSPAFGVDSTAVGGLYAGRITLLSTEAGVAVRAPREMAASSGGMTLTADGRLVIGRAQASGPVDAHSNTAAVAIETSLFADDAISLTGTSAEVAAGATLATSSDLTIAADTVDVGAGGLVASGMNATGTLGASGDLSIVANTIAATDARLAAAGDADLRADAITLDQASAAQALSVQGSLAIETQALSATGADVAVGGDTRITSAGTLSMIGGDYAIAGDLEVAAADLSNSANVQAGGDIDLTTSGGNLSNTGDISAAAALTLTSVGGLTTSGALTAGTTATLTAIGDVTNTGSVVTTGDLTVTGANVFNSGPLGSSTRDVAISTLGDITNTGLLYGGRDITLSLDGTLLNATADIIAEGDITIAGLTGPRAASLRNRSANIEAITGSIMIAAALVENSQPVPTIVPQVAVTSVTGTVADFPNINHPSNTYQVIATTTVTTMVVAANTNAPARILAGDDVTIDANIIINDYSQIAANGDVTLNATTITNTGQDLIQTTEVVTTSYYRVRYCPSVQILGWCPGGYSYHHYTRDDTQTTTATAGALFATIQAGGTLTANATGYLNNNAVRGNATQVGLSSGGRALAAPPLIGSVNPNAILNRSGLFAPSNTPNGPFLIETRSEFIDVNRFLSSDYFLQQIGGYDANITMRRFGDAYVEARLIQEQLFALTGRRTAADPDALRAIMQRFYDNALTALDDLSLTPGVALTPEQVATLTDTIIWMEEQEIDGQIVLVPVVYLGPNAADEISLASAQLVAPRIDIDAGTAINSGLITGETSLEIATTGNLLNIGGQIASIGDVDLNVDGRFANVSGQVTGEDVTITAADIENSTAVIRDQTRYGYADRIQAIGTITATGNLDITATTNITSEGGQFSAGGDASLQAGGTIAIGAVMIDTVRQQEFSTGYDNSFTREAELAGVTAGGNLTIAAGEDLTIAGAEIEAGGDAALSAVGDVEIASVQESEQHDLRVDIDTGGFFGVEINIRQQDQEVTTEQTTVTAGGDLTITSGTGGVTLEAPALASGGETIVSAANGQVAILTTEDSAFTRYEYREEDLLWWSSIDTGSSEITRTFTQIEAGGGLQIISGGDIIVEYTATGNFSEGIAQLASAPGLEWMGQLEAMDNVAWQEAQTAFEEWNYEEQGLTEAGALLVTVVTTFVLGTPGIDGFITATAGNWAGGSVFLERAFAAGLRTLATQATVSAVNNQGDLGAVLEELGSAGNMRGLITSMVSAGLAGHLTDSLNLPDLPEGASFADQALRDLQLNLVRTTVNATVSTAINGGDLGEALFDGWTNAMVIAGLSVVQNEIGDMFTDAEGNPINGGEGSISHVIAHAVAGGLAAELQGEDFADGALGAAIAALAGGLVGESGLSEARQVELQNLIAVAATLIASDGDASAASLAGAIASSAHENNYLSHQDIDWLAQAMERCDAQGGCSQEEITALSEQMQARSLANDEALAICLDQACIDGHLRNVASRSQLQDIFEDHPDGRSIGVDLIRNSATLLSGSSGPTIEPQNWALRAANRNVRHAEEIISICGPDVTCRVSEANRIGADEALIDFLREIPVIGTGIVLVECGSGSGSATECGLAILETAALAGDALAVGRRIAMNVGGEAIEGTVRQGSNGLEVIADNGDVVQLATNSRPAHLTSHPDAHTVGRHGPQVTDQQLETRALTGVAPDGSTLTGNRIPPLSSAFHSEGTMLRADSVMRGQPLQNAIAANPTANRHTFTFNVGEDVGRGYRRIGSGNPNNVGRNGPPERVDGLTHAQVTVERNSTTGAWETITMFPALP